ncbi:universal stress protein [Haloarcula onubensis]|uniref:Universal stress protein n=1 Tax=Haloarcula onubensis TaxID=2950539 RepID=A0ABU2FR25_9EURY|nr:universal stress protein [Halomicroarcula sp. S3CR25-11]MDS0282701.1 universal stress protein [Halomicroarcula sp. S3CR25-11]
MYESILFPTDGSDGAAAALEHAVDHARQYGATLHVLFVADTEAVHTGMVGEEHDEVPRSEMVGEEHRQEQPSGLVNEGHEGAGAAVEHGEEVVGEATDAIGDDVAVETAVVTGTPYERILDYADEHGVDLVVMGTHGRTGLDRYLLGSVTEKVVRTADVPVLTVRMTE